MNTTTSSLKFRSQADEAIARIAPLWPLSRFVAVNPFVGLSSMPFNQAAGVLERNVGTALALPPSYYEGLYASGKITSEDLAEAIGEVKADNSPEDLIASLHADAWELSPSSFGLPSALIDSESGTRWGAFVTEEISKWCTAYFDGGQALWGFPWKGIPLFKAWREAASLDTNPEVAGLRGWRDFVRGLGDDPVVEIARAAELLGLDGERATEVFHSLLLGINGWAGHLKFLAHEKSLRAEEDDTLRHLLAIRLIYESALQNAFPAACSSGPGDLEQPMNMETAPRFLWQRAHEIATRRKLFGQLASLGGGKEVATPEFQAVFCIDVRSEVFRRALEQVYPPCGTIGFAGFFGFPIEAVPAGETSGTPQCPVLLNPAVKVPSHASPAELTAIARRKRFAEAWKSFKNSAVSSFVFVETLGLGFLGRMIRDLLGYSHPTKRCDCDLDVSVLRLETKLTLAAGALRHMGMADGRLSRLVLLCGHGSTTENNPYGSSLDCGACGGHTGEANARTAVDILNDPEVRKGLLEKGMVIPEETLFLAGLHNTTTDEVTLFGIDAVPASHRAVVEALSLNLGIAGSMARKQRAPLLGLNPSDRDLDAKVLSRSRDWSQVRPEWGLAGNHAFIAAPRKRTRGLNLGGRVFLHDYRHDLDEGEATLELLLTAPVVVASWINLQYFGSTVDNRLFGAGDKTIHNVAGLLGVYEGNGGDIRTGLPIQSVHDGFEWRHEPLRLAVIVEAPVASIDKVLAKHRHVSDLVANGWIRLFVMGKDGRVTCCSDGRGGWTPAKG
jgi:uncharacterized protein YbcC (UPF0753/DUF2309 family)